jgi:hypothetical protein
MNAKPSPLSGSDSRLLFTHRVLGKYEAQYFYDETAGYIFVGNPHWLDEAYSSAIAITDTGVLQRNVTNIDAVARAIIQHPHSFTKGVDLGGGYGIFVRGMRDAGFEFYWTDRYSQNLMARGFEAEAGRYSTATAFELLEHLENPLAMLKSAKELYDFDTCFFSATCFDEENVPDADWWYWAFETGQHISFFSLRSLNWMADQLGMKLWHVRGDVYAFSKLPWQQRQSGRVLRLTWRLIDRFLPVPSERTIARLNSLTTDDHFRLRDALRRRAS